MGCVIGIDIGGTKCAVVQGDENGNILGKIRMDTGNVHDTLENIFSAVASRAARSRTLAL